MDGDGKAVKRFFPCQWCDVSRDSAPAVCIVPQLLLKCGSNSWPKCFIFTSVAIRRQPSTGYYEVSVGTNQRIRRAITLLIADAVGSRTFGACICGLTDAHFNRYSHNRDSYRVGTQACVKHASMSSILMSSHLV